MWKPRLISQLKQMISIITVREIKSLLITGRFSFCCSVLAGLLILSSLQYESRYAKFRKLYESGQESADQDRKHVLVSMASNLRLFPLTVHWAPSVMQLISDGGRERFPNEVHVSANRISKIERNLAPQHMYKLGVVVDWSFVIGVVFSLIAGVYSFDAMTSERQSGTLALLLSNSLPRSSVVIGKFFGIILCSIVALTIGMLGSLVVAYTRGVVPLSEEFIVCVIVSWLVSCLYGGLFVLLGLLCSILCTGTKASAAAFLSAWALVVLLLPALSSSLLWTTIDRPFLPAVVDQAESAAAQVRSRGAGRNIEEHRKNTNDLEFELDYATKYYVRGLIAANLKMRGVLAVLPRAAVTYCLEGICQTGLPGWITFFRSCEDYRQALSDYFASGGGGPPVPPFQPGKATPLEMLDFVLVSFVSLTACAAGLLVLCVISFNRSEIARGM